MKKGSKKEISSILVTTISSSFDLLINSLKLRLPSSLTSTLTYVKFKNLMKLLVALKSLCTLIIFRKPFAQSQNRLD